MNLLTQVAYWAAAHEVTDTETLKTLHNLPPDAALLSLKVPPNVAWHPAQHWPFLKQEACATLKAGPDKCLYCFPNTTEVPSLKKKAAPKPKKKVEKTTEVGPTPVKAKAGDVFVVQCNAAGDFVLPKGTVYAKI